MKKLCISLLFLFFFNSFFSQSITFGDPIFKSVLLSSSDANAIAKNLNGDYFAVDSNSNSQIELTEALEVSELDVSNFSISSLAGIGNFTNLTSLDCQNNLISNLNTSNLTNLNILNCSNNQLNNLNISNNFELLEVNCSSNSIANLNADSLENLIFLDCSYNQISQINLNGLFNIQNINISNNQLNQVDLSDLILLTNLNCNNNLLTSINVTTLVNLITIDCSFNSISNLSISNLNFINSIDCSHNLLTSINLSNSSTLENLDFSYNQINFISSGGLTNLKNLNCSNNVLTLLYLNSLSLLQFIDCSNNQIGDLNIIGLNNLITLNCNYNNLNTLNLTGLVNLKYFYCTNNYFNTLNISQLITLLVFDCKSNFLNSLNFDGLQSIQFLYCDTNNLTTLNLNNLTNLVALTCTNNSLTDIFIKNGIIEGTMLFNNNPNLQYICADENEVDFIQYLINSYNYSNCSVSSYCSFTPGGNSYVVNGSSKYDFNDDGCDALDTDYSAIKLSFNDGINNEISIANTSGNYSNTVKEGNYLVTPILENSNYFTLTPSNFSVSFPDDVSPYNQNFCITKNGNHSDLEVILLPLNSAIPGADVNYKILLKNKGTISQSGTITLNFDDSIFDYVSSSSSISSQFLNAVNWNFTNLAPLQTQFIIVSLNLNSQTENPPVNLNDTLTLNAFVTYSNTDENSSDNSSILKQVVSGANNTIEKLCLEGNSVSTTQVGNYVHYIIRFKNTGTSNANNVVVKDIIDLDKFDISTLITLDSNYLFTTKITEENKVEFIFENINLPPSNNNECYVAFKIKIKSNLIAGDNFENNAIIYFDYNLPVNTNTAVTTIQQLLSTTSFNNAKNKFTVYPNPVDQELNIFGTNTNLIKSAYIYNNLGQLIIAYTNINFTKLDVSYLKQGNYILNIQTDAFSDNIKFIKK